MITEVIISTLLGIIRGLVAPLPTYQLDADQWQTGATSVGAYASALNGYAPIGQLGLALTVLLGVKAGLLLWQAVIWLYHQFWGSN